MYAEGGVAVQLLTRSFSNASCITACDQFQSLPELYGLSSSEIQFRLNYFRCYTFEGGNDDDVTNASASPNVVCKSTFLFPSLLINWSLKLTHVSVK